MVCLKGAQIFRSKGVGSQAVERLIHSGAGVDTLDVEISAIAPRCGVVPVFFFIKKHAGMPWYRFFKSFPLNLDPPGMA